MGDNTNCGIVYYLKFVSLNMLIVVYGAKAGILYYIYYKTKNKLKNAKLLLVHHSKKYGYKSLSNSYNKTSSKNGLKSIDDLNTEPGIECDNVGDAIYKFEKDFYKSKFRVSKRVEIILCIVQLFNYSIIATIIIFAYGINQKRINHCMLPFNEGPMIIFQSCFYSNLLIFTIKIIKIRKIHDSFFIRNEIYTVYVILIIFFIVDLFFKFYHKHTLVPWAYLSMTFVLLIIGFVLPILKSYQTFNKIKNTNTSNGNNNDDDDTTNLNHKDKKTDLYQLFKSIINEKEKVSYWIQFAQNNYSVENIMFYRSVNEFKRAKCKKAQKALSQNIINNYIKTSSPLIINISSIASDSVLNRHLTNPLDKDIFNHAIKEILNLMYINSFPVFYNSIYHHQMMVDNTFEEPSNYFQNLDDTNSDTKIGNVTNFIKMNNLEKQKNLSNDNENKNTIKQYAKFSSKIFMNEIDEEKSDPKSTSNPNTNNNPVINFGLETSSCTD
ncbi:regulator of g protein signaling [Anaeramoeba flamelloides]|uniref:Regulator of g protein signaling n=1 Tax=Anaeramoeba flamelloides TaxID=1746091 RepID=A0AAV7Y9J6_9EUKA|nr:regulator of g protein signaling [Anaeramoeba flamelloides]